MLYQLSYQGSSGGHMYMLYIHTCTKCAHTCTCTCRCRYVHIQNVSLMTPPTWNCPLTVLERPWCLLEAVLARVWSIRGSIRSESRYKRGTMYILFTHMHLYVYMCYTHVFSYTCMYTLHDNYIHQMDTWFI